MRPDDLRSIFLFDRLSDAQLQRLLDGSAVVTFDVGQLVFVEGDPADDWWVLLDGALDLVRRTGGEETVVGGFDVPGRWSGGFRAWDDAGVYLASGRGIVAGRMLRVPAPVLRAVLDEFPLASHLVEGLFHTARNIEEGARRRESLVALGRLSAGLAHELNNPAAAASRAVDALATTCDGLLESLAQLARAGLTAAQFTALDTARRSVPPPGAQHDAVAQGQVEDELSDWLDAHGVNSGWELAPTLAAAGVDVAWCEQATALLPAHALEPGLRWVASTQAADALLSEIKLATGRVSELVGAVRSYSQMDRAARQQVDVTEGIESTLVMLGHKLRGGIEVVRAYDDDVPAIDVYPGAMNQVWTNLIDNAVDAMGGTGTLRIATRRDGPDVVVEVGDTGAGMPPEVVRRAFDPFFTTKPVGEGTGLGLDIARRIVVERHHGTIAVTSEPGDTVFRVTVPIVGPTEGRTAPATDGD